MKRTGLAVLGILLTISAMGAIAAQTAPVSNQATAIAKKPTFGNWGVDLSGMDKTVAPGDDFFRYVNGAWYDKAVIPSDRTSTGAFVDLDVESEDRVRGIMGDLETRKDRLTPAEKRVRDLYHSYVDTARVERFGLKPAEKDLQAIAAVRSLDDVARAMASVAMGTQSIFRTGIGIDDKNPDAYVVTLGQSGLGLPDRDYYLLDEKGIVAARDAYRTYVAGILKLGAIADADSKATAIFDLETAIAKLHWARAERRNAEKTYNPMSVAELETFAPQFPWRLYLKELGISGVEQGTRRVVVSENTAFPQLAALFANTPVSVWRDYLTYHYLSSHASYLPQRFDDARFAFYGKVLGGQMQQLAREKRGVRFVDGVIGQEVGKIYVAKYFSPEAKAKAQNLVANLLDVYRQRIQAADWMSPATRQKALEKAANFTVKIGYPDKWRDYSKFQTDADDLLGNAERASLFEWNRKLVRLDQPVDRSEWEMSPQTVNAYYEESLNEIVFPAAILQPPFFDPNADDAVNYGGIGAVIGHEISHGFDDQGSKYDAKGVLQNWWTPSDRKNFEARTASLAKQYGTYSPVKGMFINGELTLGENIADLAGLTVAQAAYHLSLKGKEPPVLDGFTGDQRLFMGYAQVWRYKAHEETARQRLLSDPHSPPEFRISGAVRNVDAWYQAFNVKPENRLFLAPEARVHLW
ncbi:MAG TPA: M13 family metallopeptidase [Micropepsaceae bacterium]